MRVDQIPDRSLQFALAITASERASFCGGPDDDQVIVLPMSTP
jgi:hypothetical protein